jgi:uncharacterized protein YjcR
VIKLLSSDQAADKLGVSSNTLRIWRSTDRINLPYFKIGALVKYSEDDIDAYINQNRHESNNNNGDNNHDHTH